MTYQTLIVKDTRDVNKCWKWSIIVTLLCVVATGLAVTFSFHALLDNFNTNCISGAKLAFKTTTAPPAAYLLNAAGGSGHTAGNASGGATSSSSSSSTETPNYGELGADGIAPIAASDASSSSTEDMADVAAAAAAARRWHRLRHNYSEQFREHFEPIVVVDAKLGVNKLRRMTLASGLVMLNAGAAGGAEELRLEATVRQQLARNEEDIEFFDSQMIDELNTFWGPMAPCEYISFVPLIEAIVAIVWVTMFMMCGNGGRSKETFVDEPWRIVLPAFVFFALMTVISAVHLIILLSRLAHFCSELKHNFHDQSVPCALLINQFSMNDDFAVPPSHNYVLAITFSWLRLLFWTLTVAVMTARCFKGTDFELVDASSASSTATYNNNNNNYSGTTRPSRALLNGYTTTSDSGGDEATTTAELSAKTAMNRVHRVRLTAATKSSEDEYDDDDDDNDDEYATTDDGSQLAADGEHVPANMVTSGAVHVNGVEFRPSAQMRRSVAATLRSHPAIAEEEDAEQLMPAAAAPMAAPGRLQSMQGGSNCRRLVNEIDLVREAKPKRLKKYLDSKA